MKWQLEKTTSHENKTPIRCVYICIYLHRSFKPSPQTKMFVTRLLINSCHLGPEKSPRYYVNMKMAEVRGSFLGILGIPNHRATNHQLRGIFNYLHEWLFFNGINVGKYTSPIECLGCGFLDRNFGSNFNMHRLGVGSPASS